MNYQDIINEWLGRKVGDGECVIWAAQFACQAYNVCYLPTPETGGARDIWEQNTVGEYFDKITNGVPPQGSLVIWGKGLGNYYGHIGVATGEGDANYFTSYDSGWSDKTVQKITHNYNNVLGWLVPKTNQGETMTPEQAKQIADRFNSIDKQISALSRGSADRFNSIDSSLKSIANKPCGSSEDSRLTKVINFFKGL